MLQQNMTKYFSRADGMDFVGTGSEIEEYLDTGFSRSQQVYGNILTNRVLVRRFAEIMQSNSFVPNNLENLLGWQPHNLCGRNFVNCIMYFEININEVLYSNLLKVIW